MKIFVTGGTGFVGRHVSELLLRQGHHVTAVGTRERQNVIFHDNFQYISADTARPGPWQEGLTSADAVINLAGKTIFSRWTEQYKKSIYDSRVLTTRNLVEAFPHGKPLVFCSTSATGYYGDGKEQILTESSSGGDDFLARVANDWEAEALRAQDKGARVVSARFGVVLGKGGGMMQKVIPAFRFYVGGPLGNGMQWFPWIHMEDLLAAFMFVIEDKRLKGAVNFCAPHPVRNKDFSKTLGRIMNKPSIMRTPVLLLRIIMGELSAAILCSQRAVPEKLLKAGFAFKFPRIEDALSSIVHS